MTDDSSKKEQLLFDIQRSVRYHNRRVAFYERFSKTTSAVSLIFGSSSIYAVLKEHKMVAVILAAIVTAFSIIDLIVGTSSKARLHSDLSRRFTSLEKALLLDNDVADEKYNVFYAERLDIEADEPPPLRVLDSICYNELLRSMGYDMNYSPAVKITWYQRWFSQIIDIREHAIVPLKEKS